MHPEGWYGPGLVDRTLVIVKPDGVERGLVGEIIGRLEHKGLTIAAAELRTITKEVAGQHYAEHDGKPFFADLIAFITRSPAMIMVVEGPGDTFKVVRTMMGATNPKEAAPGTIRGDLAIETTENLVHGSDSPESAAARDRAVLPRTHLTRCSGLARGSSPTRTSREPRTAERTRPGRHHGAGKAHDESACELQNVPGQGIALCRGFWSPSLRARFSG